MPTFYYPKSTHVLEGKTIVIPVVSTANLSQLAVDLIITTFSLKRIGIFDSRFCIAAVGARDDGTQGITTPLELYGSPEVDFVVLQQRSPVLKTHKEQYISALLDFIKSDGFGAILLLSGVNLSNRTDSQMMTPTYHIHLQNAPASTRDVLTSLAIPRYTSIVQQFPTGDVAANDIPFIPGGGLTRRLLRSLLRNWDIPTTALLQFVLEGDNRQDAAILASIVLRVLGKDTAVVLKQPHSWQDGLFGTSHDQSLYG